MRLTPQTAGGHPSQMRHGPLRLCQAAEYHPRLIHLALGEAGLVAGAGVFVILFGVFEFGFGDQLFLLGPALVDALEAPFDTALGSANGFAVDLNEDGIGVR